MNSQQQWDYSFDVVVVGSGNGGMTAALCSYEMGTPDVLVVEKSNLYGGTSSISGGGVWIPCNRYAKAAGAEDSAAKAKTYLRQLITEEEVPEYQLDAYLENGPKMVEFMHQRTRMRYVTLEHYPDYYTNLDGAMHGHRSMEPETFNANELGDEWRRLRRTHPMMHLANVIGFTQVEAALLIGQQPGWWKTAVKLVFDYLIDIPWRLRDKYHRRLATGCAGVARLRASMQDRDIPLWLNTSMTKVVDENGKVLGIEVLRDGKRLRIEARKAVVLAAGGFDPCSDGHAGPGSPPRWCPGRSLSTSTGSASTPPPTRCATGSRHAPTRRARTSASCRSCAATRTSPRRRSTPPGPPRRPAQPLTASPGPARSTRRDRGRLSPVSGTLRGHGGEPMNWRRFGQVLWVVGGVIAGICGMEWHSKASNDGFYITGSYVPPPPVGILYPALTIVFGVVALIGVACILSARDPSDT